MDGLHPGQRDRRVAGLAFVLGGSARTIPTGGLRGLIGLVSAVVAYYVLIGVFGDGFRAIGAIPRGHGLGSGRAPGRSGLRPRRGDLAARARSASSGRGGAPGGLAHRRGRRLRCAALGRRRPGPTDPGAFVLAAEAMLGLALPWVLLRRGERLAGYVAVAILAVLAALAIGPLTTVLRAIADTF